MNRKQTIEAIFKLYEKAVAECDYRYAREAINMNLDWNQQHDEEEEIFGSEAEDYFMVEDDVIYFTEGTF